MNDIVERLKEPELHYPGNFRTPLRANAMLSCLCQEAAETIESLRQQLAMFNSAVEHVTEYGKTKRSFSVSEGWAMVHKDRLIDLECTEEQLAASQAREVQLREALTCCVCAMQDYQAGIGITEMFDKGERLGRLALQSITQDTAALSAMIAKAGEVMRERCLSEIDPKYYSHDLAKHVVDSCCDEIRALPGVTLGDLKK